MEMIELMYAHYQNVMYTKESSFTPTLPLPSAGTQRSQLLIVWGPVETTNICLSRCPLEGWYFLWDRPLPLWTRRYNLRKEEEYTLGTTNKVVVVCLTIQLISSTHTDTYLEQQQTKKLETEVGDVDRIRITKVHTCCPVLPSGGS